MSKLQNWWINRKRSLLSDFLGFVLLITLSLAFVYLANGVINQFNPAVGTTEAISKTSSLVTALFSFIAAVASIWSIVSARQNAERIEELKQQLNTQFPALKDSRSAALNYYRSISKLETNNFDFSVLEQSENVMIEAESNIFFLSEKYQKSWYGYWQEARNISHHIREINNLEEAKKQWVHSWSKRLAEKLKGIAVYQPVS